jgi:hypothetical protein
MMLIGIFKQEICIYGRKFESYLIKTNECLLNLKGKSPDFRPDFPPDFEKNYSQ